MPTLQQQFGLLVRERRRAAKLSQEALAHDAGLHPTYVSLLERGKRAATLVVVQKLARALGVTMVELIGPLEVEVPNDKREGGSKPT